jgi:hypothetical protein
MPSLEDELRALFQRLDDRAHEDLVAFVVMAMGPALPEEELSPRLLALLERFSQRAGIANDDAPAAVKKKITAYYREHPLDATASKELERLLLRAVRDEGRASADFARLLGNVQSPSSPEPAPGGVRAGPLARTLLNKPKDEN